MQQMVFGVETARVVGFGDVTLETLCILLMIKALKGRSVYVNMAQKSILIILRRWRGLKEHYYYVLFRNRI